MGIQFTRAAKILGAGLLAVCLFAGGYVAGQAKFGQPKTILHVVEIQWRPGVQQMDKEAAIAGIKDMASKMPGIKNIWVKWDRLEPRDFSAAFAIEFRSREAADVYAESPLHEAWEKEYVPLRAASISIQVTNP
jgi:Stress responsive A/B Barrel Domain